MAKGTNRRTASISAAIRHTTRSEPLNKLIKFIISARRTNILPCDFVANQGNKVSVGITCFDQILTIATIRQKANKGFLQLLLRNSNRKHNHMPASFGG